MARTLALGFGCACPGISFYGANAAALSAGVSRATVGGLEALQFTGGGGGTLLFAPNNASTAPSSTQSRCWVFNFYLSGTLGAGVVMPFATLSGAGDAFSTLRWVRQSDSTYKVGLYDTSANQDALSSTTYNTDTWITIRVVANNPDDTVTVDIDGVTEMDAIAETVANVLGGLSVYAASSASYTHNYNKGALWKIDSLDDRPGTDLNVYFIYPNGDDETATFGNDNTNCNDGAGSSAEWDDWNGAVASHGDHDSGTTMNVECGGNAGEEISTMSSVAVDDTLEFEGAIAVSISAAQLTAKTIDTYFVLKDSNSGTQAEIQNANFSSTSWFAYRTRHVNPPSGAWADYIASGTFNHASATRKLYAGIRSVDTNTANDDHSAIGIELIMVDNDPPAAAATRRRTGPTLMSPGIF